MVELVCRTVAKTCQRGKLPITTTMMTIFPLHTPQQPLSYRRIELLVLVLLVIASLSLTENHAVVAETVTCPTGWGGSSSGDGSEDKAEWLIIPEAFVNDGYCDCPTTGADEPNTDACSGHENWAGTIRAPSVVAVDPSSYPGHHFVCPQQPNLRLGASKIRDGICDCCDGADEYPNVGHPHECPDQCEILLATERAEQTRRFEMYRVGAMERLKHLQAFQIVKEDTRQRIVEVEREKNSLQDQLDKLIQLQEENRIQRWLDRQNMIQALVSLVSSNPSNDTDRNGANKQGRGLLYGLTNMELLWVIVHACQVAGEMNTIMESVAASTSSNNNNNRDRSKTCIPLRLAGLDAGLVWEPDTYKALLVVNDRKDLLAEILDFNTAQDKNNGEQVWNEPALRRAQQIKGKKNHRRLEEDLLTEDYPEDYDDYAEDDATEEDEPSPDGKHHERKYPDDERRDRIRSVIERQPFCKNRNALLEFASSLIKRIDELLNETKEGTSEEEGIDVETTHESGISFDPMALPMVKTQIDRRQKIIRRGFEYAVSAMVLMDEVQELTDVSTEDAMRMLLTLALGTLAHGRLSVLQFWEILANVLPELQESDDSTQTCRAPFLCPPRAIQRESVSLPPMDVIAAVDPLCRKAMEEINQQACALPLEANIPNEITSGFMGHVLYSPPEDDDWLRSILSGWELADDADYRAAATRSGDEIHRVEEEKRAIDIKLSEMQILLADGGEGKDSFGPNGELYALRDSCFSIDSGKYTYEFCLFRSAKQSEGSNKHGTDLGTWSGASVEDGTRIWTWTNGAKCWNGPKRSATVIVTCGRENKVVSADEPETCKYVFEMESYIACDDHYRIQHGLENIDIHA